MSSLKPKHQIPNDEQYMEVIGCEPYIERISLLNLPHSGGILSSAMTLRHSGYVYVALTAIVVASLFRFLPTFVRVVQILIISTLRIPHHRTLGSAQ